MANFDKWTVLKIVEVVIALACLVFKRVTDDEARSLSLYLQKLSREWSLLNNVTWDRVGSSVADVTYGGYLIITTVLLIGKIFGEIPTEKRISEFVFLGVGAILYIVIGSLCFAAIDSLPTNLIDNAAILGAVSVVGGALFLLDMGAPKAKKQPSLPPPSTKRQVENGNKRGNQRNVVQEIQDIEREVTRSERAVDIGDQPQVDGYTAKHKQIPKTNGIKNGGTHYKNGGTHDRLDTTFKEPTILPSRSYIHLDPTSKGYQQMKDDRFDISRGFGIYGKDVTDQGSETDETASIPPKIELHSPVWSQIRKGKVSKYVIPPVVPPQSEIIDVFEKPPSGPLDPGYVQYTVQHWGESKKSGPKTPRHSPTEV
ncbi:uncharacterized protein LOC115879421 [Sitophilus oryzae]|uniref:Uncharacterized protein LOC115879421 n=1 Tax=Sitophilus oryzae TaxID=7048 RepID=A0A6J2XMM7_SITOR|nr:uncharacterized protein LOC115879421 [Sitophilus oryzae]XP_030752110.1 uncharacterized protein LOC115879421 [Sitophilus oryzae]